MLLVPAPDAGPLPAPDAAAPPTLPPPGCETGGAQGLVCAPDGSPVAAARVYADTVDCDGNPRRVEAATDAQGAFTLDGLAAGDVTIVVEAGAFQQRYAVTIVAGQIVRATPGGPTVCLAPDAAAIAVTTGDFDRIQDIVARLGFEQDIYCGDSIDTYGARALLGDWARLSAYDVVFVNCGLGLSFDDAAGRQMVTNVQRFVAQGGALYVSDLAAHLIVAAWPDQIRFDAAYDRFPELDACGTCIDCPADCGARPEAPRPDGECMGTTQRGECENMGPLYGFGPEGRRRADILSPALQQALGSDVMEVTYNEAEWVQIEAVADGVEILVRSAGEPLLVRFGVPGGGRVTFTTFHNEAQVGADVAAILRALVFQL